MTTLHIGIDPGLDGAIGFMRDSDRLLRVHSTPTQEYHGKRQLDHRQFCSLLRRYTSGHSYRVLCTFEKVGEGVFIKSRKFSASSWFTFGRVTGTVLGILHALEIPVVEIRPAVWKSLVGVTADKDSSRAMAKKLFPKNAQDFHRKKDDGKAEAALLCHVGSRMTGGLQNG